MIFPLHYQEFHVFVSSYKQRGALSAVVRIITFDLPQPELIGIPQQIIDFSKLSKGLVLITGPAKW